MVYEKIQSNPRWAAALRNGDQNVNMDETSVPSGVEKKKVLYFSNCIYSHNS